MATNAVANIGKLPELRKRVVFTLAMLAVYRIGVFITVPFVDRSQMENVISKGGAGSFLGMFDMFSGGALEQLSIFMLGIMPYISASIVMQLLTVVVPRLGQLNKEGEQGRKKINQYTRYGTILVGLVQSYFFAKWLSGMNGLVPNPGPTFTIMTMLTVTTGTAFIMWLGEQITEKGIGNGASMIIFAGIVARFPDAIAQLFTTSNSESGLGGFGMLVLALVVLGTVAVICYFERAHRRIPVQYTKRQVGRKMYQGAQSFLPMKVNMASVIPAIFASSLLMFPGQIANMSSRPWLQDLAAIFNPSDWRYNVVFVVLIIYFAYFYTSAVAFNPVEVADNLKKSGGFVPGIRPGKSTAEYIDKVLSRLTIVGALYLSAVCLLPVLMQNFMHVPFQFGGTGLLIVVGVALDVVQQMEAHLISRNYDGFAGPRGPRIRGRAIARVR